MKVAMSVSLPNLQTSTDSDSANGTGPPSIEVSVPSYPISNSSSTSYNAKPCAFFARGNCRNGTSCRFSHSNQPLSAGKSGSIMSSSSGSSGDLATPPPPILINLPPGHPVYSIDVECVATAVQHNARSIAQVALVDEWSRPVFSVLIKQDMPVLSYITELTGLTKEILDSHGLPLGEGGVTCS
jgi:CCCH-type zinc finger